MDVAQPIYNRGKSEIEMRTLYVLVEEESARAVVEAVWILIQDQFPEDTLQVKVHQGKQDLQRAIRKVVPALSHVPNARILILHDQDSSDCQELKQRLLSLLVGSTAPIKVRIVCRELESWFLGDLNALAQIFPRFRPDRIQKPSRFRKIDSVVNPFKELKRMVPELSERNVSKVWLSKTIATRLSLEGNKSESFNHFIGAIRVLLS